MASILLITPDRSFAEYATQALVAAAHQVTWATDAESAIRSAINVQIDLVMADSLAKGLRRARDELESLWPVPWVFVAPSRLPIRIMDHFVYKPASAEDLTNAVSGILGAPRVAEKVDLSGVSFDRPGQRISRDDVSEGLTPIEFRLLDYLVRVRGTIARTEDLLEQVWQYSKGTASSDVVRSHMKNLRAKMRRVNRGEDLIETVPRRGYRLA